MATTRELYRSHLDTLDRFLADAIERAGRSGIDLDTVVFHAGRARTYHADDYEIAFWATPHFRRWVPLASPEHCVVARPGKRPKVIRVLPHDYWVDTSPPPASYWENEVDLHDVNAFEEVADAAGDLGRAAYIGDSPEAAATLGIPVERIEPPALMHPLDWHRATKTEHEIALLRIAADSAAAGHLAAREVFLAGGSERELYWTFLEGFR